MRLSLRVLVAVVFALLPNLTIAQSTPDAGSDTPSPFANGIGQTATYMDQRGTPVLSITVTGIERNWESNDSYNEPQAGKDYVLVSVTLTNETGRVFVAEPYSFKLVDSLGVSTDRAWVSRDTRVMSEDTTIDANTSIDTALVFEMFSDLEPLLLMYEPEYGVYAVVHLGE